MPMRDIGARYYGLPIISGTFSCSGRLFRLGRLCLQFAQQRRQLAPQCFESQARSVRMPRVQPFEQHSRPLGGCGVALAVVMAAATFGLDEVPACRFAG
jgi:hypothetical protein